jgi:hypothetical protein
VSLCRCQESGIRDRVIGPAELKQSVAKVGRILDLLHCGAEEVGPLILPLAHLERPLGGAPPGGVSRSVVREGLFAHGVPHEPVQGAPVAGRELQRSIASAAEVSQSARRATRSGDWPGSIRLLSRGARPSAIEPSRPSAWRTLAGVPARSARPPVHLPRAVARVRGPRTRRGSPAPKRRVYNVPGVASQGRGLPRPMGARADASRLAARASRDRRRSATLRADRLATNGE